MYPLHATAGVVAFAAAATLTGTVAEAPLTTFGVAALAGLIPDLDNGRRGSVLHTRRRFFLVAAFFSPTAWFTDHRERSHSAIGLGLFAALCLLYAFLISIIFEGVNFPFIYLLAAVAGYASHLVMDMFNKPGIPLLWPIPIPFYFPPWRRLRIAADNPLQHMLTLIGFMALGALLYPYAGDIVAATGSDETLPGIVKGIFSGLGDLLRWAIGSIGGE